MRRLLAGVLLLCGCAEPNLGDAPFFCNNGLPECPEGYVCERPSPSAVGVCVRPGTSVPTPPDAAVPDQPTPDQPRPGADLPTKPDTSRPPDGPQVKWDTGPVDMPKPKPDGIPPHLGCQDNAECANDPSTPCCCPTPLLPMIWSCLPLCLDPFCI
jgi:hypothetical protein